MQLLLMRHGIAIERDDPDCPDEPDRFLTEEGVKKTREAAKGLRKLDLKIDAWVSSPYLRARQTAEITAEVFHIPKERIQLTDGLLPGADPALIFKFLKSLRTASAIAFGHAPNVDDVVALAVGSRSPITEMKKAGVAWLELRSVSPPHGELISLFPPKVLRAMAG
jgi:phosphohistidine phosphatase